MAVQDQVASDDATTEESEENSATEISTDSEFEHDGATPTQHEIPEITINDSYVRKTRGNYVEPKRVQVKSKVISSINGNLQQEKDPHEKPRLPKIEAEPSKRSTDKQPNSNLEVPGNTRTPLANPRKGDYLLNRTHSTEGIASKLSLELKKRYLLGGSGFGGSVMKSGSASNVDTKLRNFTDAISQHQKLLNPAPEPSPTMQAFLQGTSKLRSNSTQLSPLSPTNLLSSSPVRPAFSNRSSQNLTNNQISARKTFLADSSKSQLPDLVKESSILKSKTAPNIVCSESTKDRELIEEQVVPNQVNPASENTTKHQQESEIIAKICQLTEDGDETRRFGPRSPLHDAPVIVPQVDWSKSKKEEEEEESSDDSEIDSDSLSSSDPDLDEDVQEKERQLPMNFSPPRLQVRRTEEGLQLNEIVGGCKDFDDAQTFEPDSIECSLLRDKLSLDKIGSRNPKSIKGTSFEVETMKNDMEQLELQDDNRRSVSNCSSPTSVASAVSNKLDDSEENDVTTAAFTETEFSEWARDGEVLVSDDLRDVEFRINPDFITKRRTLGSTEATRSALQPARIAKEEEDLTDMELESSRFEQRGHFPDNSTSKLLANGENIDFMDTDNDSLLDDSLQDASNMAVLKNRGYVEFVNIRAMPAIIIRNDFMADAPIAKLEQVNDSCSEEEEYDSRNVIEISPVTMDDVIGKLKMAKKAESIVPNKPPVKLSIEASERAERSDGDKPIVEAVNKELFHSMEEDSLLVVEAAEDTTTSEAITVLASPVNPQNSIVPVVDAKASQSEELTRADSSNPDYLEYVKRLQSRIAEFSNAKDSIDVRKSKRKTSKSLTQSRTAEMINEESKAQEAAMNNSFNSPATSRKLEEITRERSKQKTLIQDLLMDKLEAHKQKSAEKKARRAAARASSFTSSSVLSPVKPPLPSPSSHATDKFVPTSITTPLNSPIRTTFAEAKRSLDTDSYIFSRELEQTPKKADIENKSIQERRSSKSFEAQESTKLSNDAIGNFKTPIAPPRIKHEEAKRTAEKARQDARERARLMSDEELGLSPEYRIKELRMKVARRQLSMEDRRREDESSSSLAGLEIRARSYTAETKKPTTKLHTSKSTDNVKAIEKLSNFGGLSTTSAKSMDELSHVGSSPKSTDPEVVKRDKKKVKDPERRKSIIQAVSDFFFKKESSPSPSKDKLSMFRLTSKSKGKLDKISSPKFDARPKSVCDIMMTRNFLNDNPPPIPPPPINYGITNVQVSEDSLSEDDTRTTAVSMACMQRATATEGSCNSISRKSKTTKRIARQAQLKRLRMAQEIQRKLEETEVKQRELESRGVSVEKALRGEGDYNPIPKTLECSDREEADLLREWFDLMKERTELRRYEKELLVRAQEVQLEDRHERLQQELRERLADDDDKKTSADVKKEGEILTEMLEIVAKRDSLIALLEEERQRYQDEDRDLEAQMLAKGLRLTPIKKRGPKYSV
ncbi:hypothetical protein KM043_010753 [Ampulex compressa]|nr:hypothetical protein KM043_010753 [Ampulex compressa]